MVSFNSRFIYGLYLSDILEVTISTDVARSGEHSIIGLGVNNQQGNQLKSIKLELRYKLY